MKRFFIALTFAVFLALFSAPSSAKANVSGSMVVNKGGTYEVIECITVYNDTSYIYVDSGLLKMYLRGDVLYFDPDKGYYNSIREGVVDLYSVYFPGLWSTDSITFGGKSVSIYSDYDDFVDGWPSQLKPTWLDNVWDYLYQLYYDIFGFYPQPGSILDWLADPDTREDDLTLPTNIPTPTPTPLPTPIPVQTIYLPDGNGGYTIIYQYPDPSGNPTQSPYNPNVTNDITVNCDCGGGSDPDKDRNKQDPYYAPLDYFSWGSVDGEFTDSPAYTAGQSLDIIKATVSDSESDMKVVSNSFGFLPPKWITLIGLLGAVLIVAGLIRTFLGG